ncbi:unnamed protein product [Acanthoscelides obtectus]|uniref:Uncharacterized protein n=1 Tax=Acanthoscelides obtectus TaxID=200917 RepID=A0A9P0JTN6_ACAOB|nr:unnamed protein product [Acanthoscelides obtectus]CAK1637414.1 hypothetical protein AOBTE_LOCUS9960 [Acanthoscelides obtectus]
MLKKRLTKTTENRNMKKSTNKLTAQDKKLLWIMFFKKYMHLSKKKSPACPIMNVSLREFESSVVAEGGSNWERLDNVERVYGNQLRFSLLKREYFKLRGNILKYDYWHKKGKRELKKIRKHITKKELGVYIETCHSINQMFLNDKSIFKFMLKMERIPENSHARESSSVADGRHGEKSN